MTDLWRLAEEPYWQIFERPEDGRFVLVCLGEYAGDYPTHEAAYAALAMKARRYA